MRNERHIHAKEQLSIRRIKTFQIYCEAWLINILKQKSSIEGLRWCNFLKRNRKVHHWSIFRWYPDSLRENTDSFLSGSFATVTPYEGFRLPTNRFSTNITHIRQRCYYSLKAQTFFELKTKSSLARSYDEWCNPSFRTSNMKTKLLVETWRKLYRCVSAALYTQKKSVVATTSYDKLLWHFSIVWIFSQQPIPFLSLMVKNIHEPITFVQM